jgi:hypothetical protein
VRQRKGENDDEAKNGTKRKERVALAGMSCLLLCSSSEDDQPRQALTITILDSTLTRTHRINARVRHSEKE